MCDETIGVPLMCVFCNINCFICLYSFSSPYLLVFGDDRVCGTREQMTLQVVLVERRAGARLDLGEGFSQSFILFL